MKTKLVSDYNNKYKKGFEVEVDRILFDWRYTGLYKVRVVNMTKKPVWLAISWIVEKTAEGLAQ